MPKSKTITKCSKKWSVYLNNSQVGIQFEYKAIWQTIKDQCCDQYGHSIKSFDIHGGKANMNCLYMHIIFGIFAINLNNFIQHVKATFLKLINYLTPKC